MDKQHLDGAIEMCTEYFGELIENYTATALELNAADVAAKRYQEIEPNIGLSTTANIPLHFRLDTEIDRTFDKQGLIKHYRTAGIEKIATDYLIHTVSLLDAFFEDLYEYFLRIYHPDLDDKKIGGMVRNAWGSGERMRNFFLSDLNLKKPSDKVLPVSISFDRYEDWREVRHAILHNRGRLGKKHIARLEELKARQPQGVNLSLLETPVISGNDINLGYMTVLTLRKFAFVLILYIRDCLYETAK